RAAPAVGREEGIRMAFPDGITPTRRKGTVSTRRKERHDVAMRALAASALVLALGLGFGISTLPAGAQQAVTVNLTAQSTPGVSGTATLTPMGNQTQVVIRITGGTSDPHPAHIHDGTCANLNPAPKYPLANVETGTSTSMVNVPLSQIQSSPTAINLHLSAHQAPTYIAPG